MAGVAPFDGVILHDCLHCVHCVSFGRHKIVIRGIGKFRRALLRSSQEPEDSLSGNTRVVTRQHGWG